MTEITPSPGHRLAHRPPGVADDLRLRERAGLSRRREDQARAALAVGSAAVRVVHDTDETVGMRRLRGDGGWSSHVVDMAVLPRHADRAYGSEPTASLDRMARRLSRRCPPAARTRW